MALRIQPKTYTYPSSLLQTSKWDRIKNSWLATAKVWLAPPQAESDSLLLLVTAIVVVDARKSPFHRPRRMQQLLRLTKMLEKPVLCFLLLNDHNLLLRLVRSLDARPTHARFSAELAPLEENLLTTIACFRLCRTLYELSEQVHVARWQPWLQFTLPELAPFVAGPYMSVTDHLTQLALSAAQALRELATYVLRGSHALAYIVELSVVQRVGLLLHVVGRRDAHQELLEALQGLLSALCVTARGMAVVLAVAAGAQWRRALCRVPVGQEAWFAGWGLLHYAFEMGLGADLPPDGDKRERMVADAEGTLRPTGVLEVATVCTRVHGAVLCDSLCVLGEAAARFTTLEALRQELSAETDAKLKILILQKMARPMWELAELCRWQYGREAVYIAGRHSGSLDHIARIARRVGQELEGRRVRWSPNSLDLYRAARIIDSDMLPVGRAFEPLMTMHPDNDPQSTPQLLLLSDIHARLTNKKMQLRLLCDAINNPHHLLDPEFVGHMETAANAMAASSMHSALYVKNLFMAAIEQRIKFSLPALLSLALNEAVKAAYIAAAISPPPPNYIPGSSFGLKAQKAPVSRALLYQQSPRLPRDFSRRRRIGMNRRAAALRLVCSLVALLRRTVKHLYGNTAVGLKGVMNLGDITHSGPIIALEAAIPAPLADPVSTWATYFTETHPPPGPLAVSKDPLSQWSVARVIFEALLNAHSMGADKVGLHNRPLVELTQDLCARSIKLLLESASADENIPKYLGRNGAFYLAAHIAADALTAHRLSPLKANMQLFRSVTKTDMNIPALDRLYTVFCTPDSRFRTKLPIFDIAEWVAARKKDTPRMHRAKMAAHWKLKWREQQLELPVSRRVGLQLERRGIPQAQRTADARIAWEDLEAGDRYRVVKQGS